MLSIHPFLAVTHRVNAKILVVEGWTHYYGVDTAPALRKWFGQHNLRSRSINVLTEDAHARRTWLLFHEALGPNIEVGIVLVPNPGYDAGHWWRSSDGAREVVEGTVAYIYAKLFFWPDKPKD